jgi:hypothetical protein
MTPEDTVQTLPLASVISLPGGMVAPFADAARGAEQEVVEPPLAPAHVQVQVHGPLPLTDEGVPVVHRPVDGAVVAATPFALPHCPLTGLGGSESTVESARESSAESTVSATTSLATSVRVDASLR